MAESRPWLVRCCVFMVLLCVAAVVCACVLSLLDKACTSGSYRRAAVSADSRLCSQIGKNMLQEGGSAVDGAIAALLCTSVVNPQSMGIGGGSIVTIRERSGKVKVYNFRETVPQSYKINLLEDCPKTFSLSSGSQWIGVPGELKGYEELHKQYGRLPWHKLFEPTVKLAREGLALPDYLAHFFSSPLVRHRVESTSLCDIFCNKNRTVLKKGDTLKYPKLAETMETVGRFGADAFYSGKIGRDLIEDVKAKGGTLTMEDLKGFRVRVDDALRVPLGDTVMHIPPPPAGGALLAFILQLMREFALSPSSLGADQKIQMYHRFVEAVKFANGQKRNICDPQFNNEKSAAHLTDSTFIAHIKALISNQTHEDSLYSRVTPPVDHFGTTHVSVLDEDGLAVSATSTINQLFGGAVYSPQTGIILNNELADFCGRADAVKSGEQPPSSMTPVVLESQSGRLLVIGGSGGSMITSAVALSIMNRLWLKMSLKDAISAPIVFVDSKNNVNFEPGFDESVIEGLRVRGHKVGNWKYFLNVVNAVERDNGCVLAFSDARKMGETAGY
ncbi:glutathione hydrolase 5 proenzyme [Eucyclogobius newberryi]|uniref:glutathione hydrolase 5 proenzyme n=1 Tax=Eucyclogobius newberryi TaxID=166745 RepID=UPI003B5AD7A7